MNKLAYGQKYNYHGEMLTVNEICERSGASKTMVYNRLRLGWSAEQAADAPNVRKEREKGKPRCGAETWRSCFDCMFPDCIASVLFSFKDDPVRTDPYFINWRGHTV